MAWSRLEPGFSRHPKRIKTGPIASWLWTCSVDHCTEYRTDSFVDEAAIPTLCPSIRSAALKKAVADLVAVGSWGKTEGGYFVHGYLDHNPTAEQVEADRSASRDRYQPRKQRRSTADATALATEQPAGAAATPTVVQSFGRSVDRSVSHPRKNGFDANGGHRHRDSTEAIFGWESV